MIYYNQSVNDVFLVVRRQGRKVLNVKAVIGLEAMICLSTWMLTKVR